jgi:hypothetical protein
MQISGVSLALTWPLWLCLFRVFLGTASTATNFPLSKHTRGGGAIPAFSRRRVYLQFTWEVGFLPLLWSFPPTATFTSSPTPGWWAGPSTPAFFGWLVYLQFCGGLPFPSFCTQGAPPSLLCVFFCCCLLFSFSFFPGGGWSVQGTMLIWPRIVCGSTACCLAHLVVCFFPSGLGTGIWQCRSPSCFSI